MNPKTREGRITPETMLGFLDGSLILEATAALTAEFESPQAG